VIKVPNGLNQLPKIISRKDAEVQVIYKKAVGTKALKINLCNMLMDISTHENRIKEKRQIQIFMHENLNTALHEYERLNKSDRRLALEKVRELKSIQYEIESKAREFGYSQGCKEYISDCKGVCCRWHFPRKLNYLDFFIVVCGLSKEKLSELASKIIDFSNEKFQCPVLCEDGCFLSFDNRPVVCTSAYPCFAVRSYWEFLKKKKTHLNVLYEDLDQIIRSSNERKT
jgi:hypothetical protein